MTSGGSEHRPPTGREAVGEALLDILRQVACELHPARAATLQVGLDSSLERDLGLDSLGRVEVAARLEGLLAMELPEAALMEAETPRELLEALDASGPPEETSPLVEAAAAPLVDGAEPDAARSLTEVLEWHCQRHPDRRHVLFLDESGRHRELSYGDLLRRARTAAAGLRSRGIEGGDTVGLMLPTGLEYFVAFVGTLLVGAVPVPLYPPVRRSQIEDHLRRQAGILETSRARLLVTFDRVLPLARLLAARLPAMGGTATVADLESDGGSRQPPTADQEIAFLQFTSGSTGNPKGVILTHANLLANLRSMGSVLGLSSADVVVSWLPLYHDMGLIGAWMGSLYFAMPLVLLSPLSFLTQPARWLEAIQRHRGTISAAPNFAYELCLKRLAERDLGDLDLSSWRLALNGAEPVSPRTLDRFIERFEPHGFHPEIMTPVYGLAENSLGLTFPPPGRGPRIDRLRREPFVTSGRAVPAASREDDALEFVGCGDPIPGHEIRIVDGLDREVGERQEGRLQFRGPSSTSGYYRNPEATRSLRRHGWLESGDLAYVAGGEIFVTGRVKDVIIRAGRNIYPQEVEEAVGAIDGTRRGCIAVFGTADPESGTERVVILAETRETDPDVQERIRTEIRELALELLGTPPDDVVLAPPHTVAKTSSGKIRRAASREIYESGRLDAPRRAVWWQVVRLGWQVLGPSMGRLRATLADLAYGLWCWVLFALAAAPAWLAVALLPTRSSRWRMLRSLCRILATLSATRIHTQGLEHLESSEPLVLAINHQSYLDAFALTAVFPRGYSYVAKREFTDRLVTRVFLERLGTRFVERFDPGRSAAEADSLARALEAGESLAFFPEGTFRRASGLRALRMGAFKIAAETSTPVVPVALRGSRSKLREGDWLPRRGPIHIHVAEPLTTPDRSWSGALGLRDATRRELLRHCGEPDLAGDGG